MDHGDLGGEAGQEERLFEGGVAAAGDGDGLVAEEEAVAGGAGRDAVAEEAVLVGHAQHERAGAGGDDEGVGEQRRLVGLGVAHPDLEGPGRDLNAADLGGAQLGLEAQAWARMIPMSSGPMMPSTKPG